MAAPHSASRTCLILIAGIGWLALIIQLYLIIENRTSSIPETIIRYFSFFTILTNLLVAIFATSMVLHLPLRVFTFFSRPSAKAAICLYITIVGLVYNVILRVLWDPHGLEKVVDELLHTIIPVLYIIYWLVWAEKKSVHWTNILLWLIFPAAYALAILLRGSFAHWYPYPFVNVDTLGYRQVLINSGVLVLVFLVFALVIVGIGKMLPRNHSSDDIVAP